MLKNENPLGLRPVEVQSQERAGWKRFLSLSSLIPTLRGSLCQKAFFLPPLNPDVGKCKLYSKALKKGS